MRGLILDFDGLVIDSETAGFHAWRAEARRLGGDLDAAGFGRIVGTLSSAEHIVTTLLGEQYRGQATEIADRVWRASQWRPYPVLPGVAELLAEAEAVGLPVAIASSSDRKWVTGHLAKTGLADLITTICCSDDVGVPKPEPDVYLGAVKALGLAADDVMAVEDSRNGLTAAKAAGLACVVVPGPTTAGQDLTAADARLDSLAGVTLRELAALVDRAL